MLLRPSLRLAPSFSYSFRSAAMRAWERPKGVTLGTPYSGPSNQGSPWLLPLLLECSRYSGCCSPCASRAHRVWLPENSESCSTGFTERNNTLASGMKKASYLWSSVKFSTKYKWLSITALLVSKDCPKTWTMEEYVMSSLCLLPSRLVKRHPWPMAKQISRGSSYDTSRSWIQDASLDSLWQFSW